MREVLYIDQQLELDLPFPYDRMALRTQLPKATGRHKRETVAACKNRPFPTAKDFFEHVGVDILVCIWEFLHHGTLFEILPLLLTTRGIYSRIGKEKNLLLQLAKQNFTLFYLSEAEKQRKCPWSHFSALAEYSQPASGAELAFNGWARRQLLRNSRMLKKPVFELQLVLWAKTVFEGQKRSVVVAYVRKAAVRKLQRLLQEFEEAHNGIAMKVFCPARNHYPFAIHNSTVQFLTTKSEAFFDTKKPIRATVNIRFSTNNLRYRFSLVATRFSVGS